VAYQTLAGYRTDVLDLVHDPNDVYWSQTQITNYINRALVKRDRDTGQNRTLISFTTTIGVDNYTFTNLGNTNVFDLIGVNVLYGSLRIVLGCVSFTQMNRLLRIYQPLFQSCPCAFTRYGPATVYVAPAPSIAYVLEFDCSQTVAPNVLVNPTDADPLPAPFDEPVKYYAAYLGKVNERMYEEADWFLDKYKDAIQLLDSNKVGMVPSLYR